MGKLYPLCLLVMILMVPACLSNKMDPIMPADSLSDKLPTTAAQTIDQNSNHNLLGTWTLDFDIESLTASITQNRTLNQHFNVTDLIQPPSMVVNEFNPITNVIDVDVTLTNPYNVNAYDVRLIIYLDNTYHTLLNSDNWTSLYDIPGGEIINPFKAYAKDQPNRIFASQTQHTENLKIYLHQGDTEVTFAVDASMGGNCKEPYEITGFQQDVIYDEEGSFADIKVTVRDWQNDVDSVKLHCPQITGSPIIPLEQIDTEKWSANLVNETGTEYGEYPGYILAYSSQALLYDPVTITVSSNTTAPWGNAIPLSHSETVKGSLNQDEEQWFVFYCSPAGVETGFIELNVISGSAEMTLYGSDPGEVSPGSVLGNENSILINDNPMSRYYIRIVGIADSTDYELDIDIDQKISYLNCAVYVATDDGTETGNWPKNDFNEYLTPDIIDDMIIWNNNFWSPYGYCLCWDNKVTIMSDQYYILGTDEVEQMHNEYGRGKDTISIYFVQEGIITAVSYTRYPESENNVNNVLSIYGPNVWYVECVMAHEHGHLIGYLIDQYYYGDGSVCECGDEECLDEFYNYETYLFSDPEACYDGNLMWYSKWDWTWDQYDLTVAQSQWIHEFHFRNPNNFPWY